MAPVIPLASGEAGVGSFAVTVDDPFTNASPVVENVAGLSLGDTLPFATNSTTTFILGVNALGDRIWRDDGAGGGLLGNQAQDGGETGITGVTVRVYYDANGDGAVGAGDYLVAATNTGANGLYGVTNLPDGNFVVAVETTNSNVPFGYTPTTPTYFGADLDSARTNAAMSPSSARHSLATWSTPRSTSFGKRVSSMKTRCWPRWKRN